MEEVKSLIEAGLSGYTLTVQARDGARGTIGTEEIGLHSEFDGSLEKLLEEKEPGQWITVDGGNVTLDESQAAANEKQLAGN